MSSLLPAPFAALPLGAVRPRGWLREILVRMGEGMAGRLDEAYPLVGARNGWLGGDGDSWERGPYWVDALLPLGRLLGDAALIGKADRYIEWTLRSQRPDGSFGPRESGRAEEAEAGVQKGNKQDWWPRMVMLKALISHHEAAGDPRVLDFLAAYFRHQLRTLPERPLGHFTHWGKERGGENLLAVQWLYGRTGEPWLLDLAHLLVRQTDDWTRGFLEGPLPSTHGVNLAMALKQPALAFLHDGDPRRIAAAARGLKFLDERHGQVQGMFGADELLHGTDPTAGAELCSVVEMMLSLEEAYRITGDGAYADRLERIAWNALPPQFTPDFMGRQYYQQPNQVKVSLDPNRNFWTRYEGTEILFGLLTGFPCCTTNGHQGWPKFVQRLWLGTPDGGVAAAAYGPCEVEAEAGGRRARIVEETDYPFGEEVRFAVAPEGGAPVRFPLVLRIPCWCEGARVRVNGKAAGTPRAGERFRIEREWRAGDEVELDLPMRLRISRRHENAASVERGPLVFALAIEEEWRTIPGHGEGRFAAREVHPKTPWNYALALDPKSPESFLRIERAPVQGDPWTPFSAPLRVRARGRRVPRWTEYNGSAGPLPASPVRTREPEEELLLLPYGCARLRVSEIPVAKD